MRSQAIELCLMEEMARGLRSGQENLSILFFDKLGQDKKEAILRELSGDFKSPYISNVMKAQAIELVLMGLLSEGTGRV